MIVLATPAGLMQRQPYGFCIERVVWQPGEPGAGTPFRARVVIGKRMERILHAAMRLQATLTPHGVLDQGAVHESQATQPGDLAGGGSAGDPASLCRAAIDAADRRGISDQPANGPDDRAKQNMATPNMNCDNCGACCLSQTSPPGYTGEELVLFSTPDDEERFYDAPQEAKDAIWAWQDRIDAIPNGEPLPADEPCCWLDLETRRCRWYEWRPSVCSEFEVGCESCHTWRAKYNIDVEALK